MQQIEARLEELRDLLREGRRAETVNFTVLQPQPRDRASHKLLQALAWLEQHPEHLETPSRQLAEEVGVSHMTIYKAQQQLKQQDRRANEAAAVQNRSNGKG